jgi:hypothetical protein
MGREQNSTESRCRPIEGSCEEWDKPSSFKKTGNILISWAAISF